jgi:hypothetical protein
MFDWLKKINLFKHSKQVKTHSSESSVLSAKEAPKYASLAVTMVAECDGAFLDYSAESLHDINRLLQTFFEEANSLSNIYNTLICFSCYIGETLIRHLNGFWIDTHELSPIEEVRGYPPVIQWNDGSITDPISYVFQRINNKEARDVLAFYEEAKQHASDRRMPTLEDMEVTFDVQESSEEENIDNQMVTASKNYTIKVLLGNDYFSYRLDGFEYIYDFADRRYIRIDLANAVYTDDSLFALVQRRFAEFQDKRYCPNLLSSTIDQEEISILCEQEFSIIEPNQKVRVLERKDARYSIFHSKNHDLLDMSNKTVEISQDKKKLILQFLRYFFGGHPHVLSTLLNRDNMPETLCFYRYDLQKNVTFNIHIISIIRKPHSSYKLEDLKPGLMPEDTSESSKLLDNLKHPQSKDLAHQIDNLFLKASSYLDQNHYFDTFLAYLEYNIVTGLAMPETFKHNMPILENDPQVKQLLMSLNPQNHEEAKQSIAVIKSLNSFSQKQKHVLKIFEANSCVKLALIEPNFKKIAETLFIEALTINPCLAGTFFDLGFLYYDDYKGYYFGQNSFLLAWRCWDAGRAIAPTHGMLAPVKRIEYSLFTDLAAYF